VPGQGRGYGARYVTPAHASVPVRGAGDGTAAAWVARASALVRAARVLGDPHARSLQAPPVGSPDHPSRDGRGDLDRGERGATVLNAGFYHPLVLACATATIAQLAAGGHEAGVGAGWMADDNEMGGMAFDRAGVRLERLREAVEIMRSLWTQEQTTYEGRHYRIVDAPAVLGAPLVRTPRVLIGGTMRARSGWRARSRTSSASSRPSRAERSAGRDGRRARPSITWPIRPLGARRSRAGGSRSPTRWS
jgi:Luciferase-like monooxygenase